MALTDKLTAIGDAIRAKTGTTDAMTLAQMPEMINGIETGGGGFPSELVWNMPEVSFYSTSIAYGGGYFVSVNSGTVYRSSDGINWSKINANISGLSSVNYNNGIWVGRTSNNGLVYSTDNCQTLVQSNVTSGLFNFYGISNGIWYAVDSSTNTYYRSIDGKSWTEESIDFNVNTAPRYQNGVWLRGSSGNAGRVARSTDGITWTLIESIPESSAGYTVFGFNNVWYAWTNDSSLYYSVDGGVSWSVNSDLSAIIEMISGGTKAVLSNSTGLFHTTDGVSWTQYNDIPGGGILECANEIIFYQPRTGVIYYSLNGLEWLQADSPYYKSNVVYQIKSNGKILVGNVIPVADSSNGLRKLHYVKMLE